MRQARAFGLAVALLSGPSLAAQTMGERVAAEVAIVSSPAGEPNGSLEGKAVAMPGGVRALPGLTYARLKGFRPLTLDLYLPPPRFSGPRPVIVVIHGGGWIFGSPRHTGSFADWPATLASIAGQGFVVAAPSYRFASEAPFPAALQDVKSAVRWLRGHAAAFRVDKARFVTWGDSAGGQLSAMMAVTCGVAALEPAGGSGYGAEIRPAAAMESDCVQGAVAWYGAYDFTRPIGGPFPIEQHPYFDCHDKPCAREKLEAASAVHYLDPADPPILLVHGAADRSAPLAQSQHFLGELKAHGISARLEVIPGVDHGFVGTTPAQTLAACQRALALSLDFTNALIGGGEPP